MWTISHRPDNIRVSHPKVLSATRLLAIDMLLYVMKLISRIFQQYKYRYVFPYVLPNATSGLFY